jgi:hypothetical protein
MGSIIEINDTLKLTHDEGMPFIPEEGKVYEFCKSDRRLFHLKPVRVFLVEEREDKWNFIGQAQVIELTIDAEKNETRGKFVISKIYPRDYAMLLNKYDAPEGKGLPHPDCSSL